METRKAIAKRKSTREFIKGKQIPDEILEKLLQAAHAAPVAHGEYEALHLTVIQDPDVLENIREIAVDCFRDPVLDIYYGAPTCILISSKHGSIPELDMVNMGTIAENMLLTATDEGIDCCYVWGTVLAIREEPDLADELGLPEGYDPLGSVAFGYAVTPDDSEKPMTTDVLTMNTVK